MDLLQSMQIFTTVVDTGSFTKAADALQVTRPSVTTSIQLLEATLGTRLLHRTTRRVSLTAEGELFYERVSQILADVLEAKSLFESSDTKPRGKLRVDMPVALAKPLILPELISFRDAYPEIELIVGVSDAIVDLVADGVDCVVRIGELPSSSLIGRRIGFVPMVTCASHAFLAEHGMPKDFKDLLRYHAVNFFTGKNRKIMDWQYLVNGEEHRVKLKSAILVNDSEAFIEAGLAGFGLIQAVGVGVRKHLERGEFQEILPEIQPRPKPVSVLYPSKRYLAPQVRAFVEWIDALFKSVDPRWIRQV